jgi:pyruvate formate lyase activating enzyme
MKGGGSREDPEGVIFQIQRWSLHDGAGIRTTVFLHGCPLRCAWCANPESWRPGQGYAISVENLLEEIRKDEPFYRQSGGGVTFSGGEPLLQADFLEAVLRRCARLGYHTAVETSGFFPWESRAGLFALLDQVFFDVKLMDSARHQIFTGQPNELILDTLEKLLAAHGDVTVRIPLVASVTDDPEGIRALCALLRGKSGLTGVEFLPHHNLGEGKYARLGLPRGEKFAAPERKAADRLRAIVAGAGIPVLSP